MGLMNIRGVPVTVLRYLPRHIYPIIPLPLSLIRLPVNLSFRNMKSSIAFVLCILACASPQEAGHNENPRDKSRSSNSVEKQIGTNLI